jgi:hypothetical protein
MKSQYRIDSDQGLIFKTHRGQITVEDEIEILDAILSDPQHRKGMNAVCDFSEATVSWELAQLDQFRAYVRRKSESFGHCRWAIVFPQGKDASTAKLFVALNDAFEETIMAKLFRTTEEALEWAKEEGVKEKSDS